MGVPLSQRDVANIIYETSVVECARYRSRFCSATEITNEFVDLSDIDSLSRAKRIEDAEGCQAGGCELF
jgi:hypothetical protein